MNAGLSDLVRFPSDPLYPELVNDAWSPDAQRSPVYFAQSSSASEFFNVVTALAAAGDGIAGVSTGAGWGAVYIAGAGSSCHGLKPEYCGCWWTLARRLNRLVLPSLRIRLRQACLFYQALYSVPLRTRRRTIYDNQQSNYTLGDAYELEWR